MYEDEDDMLTHESQFAGCGKQRKKQNEKTEQNSFKSSRLCPLHSIRYFQCRSHAPNPKPIAVDLQQNKSTSNTRQSLENTNVYFNNYFNPAISLSNLIYSFAFRIHTTPPK